MKKDKGHKNKRSSGYGEMSIPKIEERNLGIEIFRIVSMLMVVMLHILGHGGVYSHTEFLGDNYKVAWFMNVVAYCSVNCYALISGFANVKSNFKFRKIVYLWLEVVTLNVALTAVMHLFVPDAEVTADYWLRAFFPLVKRAFWYFCAYFLMFPLIPILNKGLLSLKKYQHIIIMLMLMAPTVFRIIVKKDNYVLGSGYSALWLICLYVIGAYFRIYGAPKWAKWYVTLPTFFLFAYVAWSYRINIESQYVDGIIAKDSELYSNRGILISYVSPCMVVMAIALLLLFMQIKVKHRLAKTVILNFSKATFGVFILHVGAAFWYYKAFWNRFHFFAELPTWKMVVSVFVASFAVYFVFSLVSIGRIHLFRLLRINKLVDHIADMPSRLKSKRHIDGNI